MSVFTANRINSIGESRSISKYYNAPCDLSRVMAEAVQGDLDLFEAIICSDIAEATAIREGYLTEADDDVKESGKKAGNAIVRFFKAIWHKIVSIIKGIGERIKSAWNKLFGEKESKKQFDIAKNIVNEAKNNPESDSAIKINSILEKYKDKQIVDKSSLDKYEVEFGKKYNNFLDCCTNLLKRENFTNSNNAVSIGQPNEGRIQISMMNQKFEFSASGGDDTYENVNNLIDILKSEYSFIKTINIPSQVRDLNLDTLKSYTEITAQKLTKAASDMEKKLQKIVDRDYSKTDNVEDKYRNSKKINFNYGDFKAAINVAITSCSVESNEFQVLVINNLKTVRGLISSIASNKSSSSNESAMLEMLMCIYEAEAEIDDAMEAPIEDVVSDVDTDDADVNINIDIETESSSLFGRYY